MSDKIETGIITKQPNYTIEVKYSPEAIEKKLMRFTTPSGDQFEISAEEMITMLVGQVNVDALAPTFVDSEKINIVNVQRQLRVKLTEDMKEGQEIRLNYEHPYPLEFALLEEIYKIAKINKMEMLPLTKEFIDETKAKLQPQMENFVKKFYKGHKQIDLEKKSLKTK